MQFSIFQIFMHFVGIIEWTLTFRSLLDNPLHTTSARISDVSGSPNRFEIDPYDFGTLYLLSMMHPMKNDIFSDVSL